LLTDKYINWEENDKIREILFDFLITNNITLNEIDANDPEVRIELLYLKLYLTLTLSNSRLAILVFIIKH